jgi:hypothetical protein
MLIQTNCKTANLNLFEFLIEWFFDDRFCFLGCLRSVVVFGFQLVAPGTSGKVVFTFEPLQQGDVHLKFGLQRETDKYAKFKIVRVNILPA